MQIKSWHNYDALGTSSWRGSGFNATIVLTTLIQRQEVAEGEGLEHLRASGNLEVRSLDGGRQAVLIYFFNNVPFGYFIKRAPIMEGESHGLGADFQFLIIII